jgi:hypothetical protein
MVQACGYKGFARAQALYRSVQQAHSTKSLRNSAGPCFLIRPRPRRCAAGFLFTVLVGTWACTAYSSFWIDPGAAATHNWAGNQYLHGHVRTEGDPGAVLMTPRLKVGDRVRVGPRYRRRVYHPGDSGTVVTVLPPWTPQGRPIYQVRMDDSESTLHPTFLADELELIP